MRDWVVAEDGKVIVKSWKTPQTVLVTKAKVPEVDGGHANIDLAHTITVSDLLHTLNRDTVGISSDPFEATKLDVGGKYSYYSDPIMVKGVYLLYRKHQMPGIPSMNPTDPVLSSYTTSANYRVHH